MTTEQLLECARQSRVDPEIWTAIIELSAQVEGVQKELLRSRHMFNVFSSVLEASSEKEARYCVVCGVLSDHFKSFGHNPRPNARCPSCRSLERDRLSWLFLQTETNFFQNQIRLLHFAPEVCLQERFAALPNIVEYVTADIVPGRAGVTANMEDLQFEDNYFDVIYCSHVLEHVSDDRRALGELYRVLDSGGCAMLIVPIKESLTETFEDPTINTPEGRMEHYGDPTHVRYYALDFADRVREVGFQVNVHKEYLNKFEHSFINRCGLKHEVLNFCVKN